MEGIVAFLLLMFALCCALYVRGSNNFLRGTENNKIERENDFKSVDRIHEESYISYSYFYFYYSYYYSNYYTTYVPPYYSSANYTEVMNVLCAIMDSTDTKSGFYYYSDWECDKSISTAVYCNWNGIECNDDVIIALEVNQLGCIPNNIGSLTSLKSLKMFGDCPDTLSRTIPESICEMSSLQVLSLDLGGLHGSIPSCVGFLTELIVINLSGNDLFGNIPNSLCNLSLLHGLDLESNRLTGSIPDCIGNLVELEFLNLNSNNLFGNIPVSICNLSRLNCLSLEYNSLSGSLPDCIGNLVELIFLYLYDNYLFGSIPNSLCNLSLLHELDIADNSLIGSLPYCIGNLGNLEFLDLYGNGLTGTLPYSMRLLSSLSSISAEDNFFTGSIPNFISGLTELETVDFTNNIFTGTIPDLSNASSLNELRLSSNYLGGTIPKYFGDMEYLWSLELFKNNFEGKVWEELCAFLARSHQFTIYANNLDCYESCWSQYEGTGSFNHDKSLQLCAPSFQPSMVPSAIPSTTTPTYQPTSSPQQSYVIIVIVVSVVGGCFILFSLWLYFRVSKHNHVYPSESEITFQKMLAKFPIHKAIVDGMFVTIDVVNDNLNTVHEITPDGKTLIDLIIDRGEKCSISVDAEVLILESMLRFHLLLTDPTVKTIILSDWSKIVQQSDERSLGVIDQVLKTFETDVSVLANATDKFGRKCIDIASPKCKEAIKRKLFLFERYELFAGAPVYKTATSIVVFAYDHQRCTEDYNGSKTPLKVALKFMTLYGAFRREIENRNFGSIEENSKHIITVLDYYNGNSDERKDKTFRNDAIVKGFVDYPYCVVMNAADHNLQHMIATQHIAGSNWKEIRRLFEQISQNVLYLHSKGVIHGDLKPTNIMEVNREIRLIDLDGSVSFTSEQYAGVKFSTAYCPPELLYLNADNQVQLRYAGGDDNNEYEKVKASPFQDMWSLGVILYLLCTGASLFGSNVEDNVFAQEDLQYLLKWDNETKNKKLMNVTEPLARNLISLLLVKDPKKRIDTTRLLDHPFLSGKQVARLAGENAEYKVFISYRVNSDGHIAQRLYSDLTADGVDVWLDSRCLKSGKKWEDGFCEGIMKSDYVVCLISEEGIFNVSNENQNFKARQKGSMCDNVLLEWLISLELLQRGFVKGIFPIFVGKKNNMESYDKYSFASRNSIPDISVVAVEEKLREHLDHQGCGLPYTLDRTVKSTVDDIMSLQGAFLEGQHEESLKLIVDKIVKMVN